jgi:GTP-binding protein LepA
MEKVDGLSAGEVGYLIAGIKRVSDTHIGDTVTDATNPSIDACPGYKEIKAMVFCGLYPTETQQYEGLKDALEKLRLNDSSFTFEPETSTALGFGFRCGFLGLLHMEIIKERLEREFGLSLISTAPTVVYRVTTVKEEVILIDNPTALPERFLMIEEPFVKVTIFVPQSYIGSVLDLCQEKGGTQKEFTYIGKERIMVVYEIPLNEILWDFYDRLKSVSKGYASMDYEFIGYRESSLTRLDILLNGEAVDALSLIVQKDKAYYKGRQIVEKLREVIPRQLYEVVIQAVIGSKVVARESVKALRKDVLAKCYGGDITRKRKLLEKQKEGKKRMKQVGRIEIPQEAFLSVLKVK